MTAPVTVRAQAFELVWSDLGWQPWPPNPELEPYADRLALALAQTGGDRNQTIRVLARFYDRDTAVSILDNLMPVKPAKPTRKAKE